MFRFNMVALLGIALLSFWITYLYLQQRSSPILAVAEWIEGIETHNIEQVQQWSIWNGKTLHREETISIIDSLHKNPEWKVQIYQQLSDQAMSLHKGVVRAKPWFSLDRKPFNLAYKVKIPSLFVRLDLYKAEDLIVSIENVQISNGVKEIGPLLPVEQQMTISLDTEWGVVSESRTLGYQDFWNEEKLNLIPMKPYSFFQVNIPNERGTLYIDGERWGEIISGETIGPLPYEPHKLVIARQYPWGEVFSEPTIVAPGEKEVILSYDPVNQELITQLGETLVEFNDQFALAAKNRDPSKLSAVTPMLKQVITEILVNQLEEVHFMGLFLQVLVDPKSIKIVELAGGAYEARLFAKEDYTQRSWIDSSGVMVSSDPANQVWEYTLRYEPDIGWQVADFVKVAENQLHGSSLEPFHSNDTLRMGTDAGYPPFEYVQGNKLLGFEIELMEWLADEMGIHLFWKDIPFNQAIDQLEIDGTLDGLISAIDTDTMQSLDRGLATVPYLELKEKLWVIDSSITESNFQSRVKTIGVINDSPSLERLLEWEKKHHVQLIQYDHIGDGYDALQRKEIEGLVVIPSMTAEWHDSQKGVFLDWDILQSKKFVILLREDMDRMAKSLNESIENLRSTHASTYNEMKKKYFPDQELESDVPSNLNRNIEE